MYPHPYLTNLSESLRPAAWVTLRQNAWIFTCPDLSENEVGALAAHELREYMRNRRCKLISLAIRKADIDDDECR